MLLLIEVADTSLRFDRAVKLPLYARACIPEVWIVDLKRRAVDVHRAPHAGCFTETATEQGDGVPTPALDPAARITLRQVFG